MDSYPHQDFWWTEGNPTMDLGREWCLVWQFEKLKSSFSLWRAWCLAGKTPPRPWWWKQIAKWFWVNSKEAGAPCACVLAAVEDGVTDPGRGRTIPFLFPRQMTFQKLNKSTLSWEEAGLAALLQWLYCFRWVHSSLSSPGGFVCEFFSGVIW